MSSSSTYTRYCPYEGGEYTAMVEEERKAAAAAARPVHTPSPYAMNYSEQYRDGPTMDYFTFSCEYREYY